MSESDRDDGPSRRKVLECMTWVGTGVLWTVSGGVPHSLGIMGEAAAAEAKGLTFLQISDSHVGFDKPANPNALGTLEEAIAKVNAQPQKPAFMIHTGDISHLSLELAIRRCRSHHFAGAPRRPLRSRRARFSRRRPQALSATLWPRHQRRRLVLVRRQRRALRRPGQRLRSQRRRHGRSRRRAARMARGRSEGPLRVDSDRSVCPHPAVDDLSGLGLGHRRFGSSAVLSEALRLGDRAQRPYPPGHAKGGRQCHVPHRALDGVSATGAGASSLARVR